MTILKILRKPYLSIFLSLLVLFVSCSPNQNEISDTSEPLSLANYVEKHLELSSNITTLLKNEKMVNLLVLQTAEDDLTYDQFNEILKKANIKEANAITEFMNEIYLNSVKFVNANPNFNSYNESEIEFIIANEIDMQINNSYLRSGDPCHESFQAENKICIENFAITAAVSVIASSGLGALIGLIQFGQCNKRAQANLADCRENQ